MSSFKHVEQTSRILSQIMTIEANVCLPSKLAIFWSKWEDGNSENGLS